MGERQLDPDRCNACGIFQSAQQDRLERIVRQGLPLIVCVDPRGCIARAQAAGVWCRA